MAGATALLNFQESTCNAFLMSMFLPVPLQMENNFSSHAVMTSIRWPHGGEVTRLCPGQAIHT